MKNPDTFVAPNFALPPANRLILTVTVGDAQMGTSAVWINEVLHSKGDFNATAIGTGAALAGKQIRVKTLVTDINSFTNKMDVTYTLEGGTAPFEHTIPFEVESEGDSAVFRAVFPITN